MSKLNDLIKEKCPNGVKFYKIKEISSVTIGEFVHKNKQSDDGQYPVYNGGISNTGFYDEYNNDGHKVIISARGANAGFINRVKGKYWAGNSCYTININDESKLDWNYLYQYLKNNQSTLLGVQQTGSIPAISKKQVEEFKIPILPIKVQEEIVRILDKFGELEAELEEELEARKTQYEFWRDKIFKFENRTDVKWLKLHDIKTDIYRGNGIKRNEVTEDGIPCVRYGEIYTTYNIWFDKCKSHTTTDVVNKPKVFSNNDLLFAITGESVEDISKTIAYTGNEVCYAGGDTVVMKHNQNGKYLAYALSTKDAIKQKSKGKVKSKVVHSSIPSIEEIVVPIVSLEEQEKIVKILDNFYNLVNSLDYGLPAEIELRRKQYEYYRNKLFSFEEIDYENVT